MKIQCITSQSEWWSPLMEYAEKCSWRAGLALAAKMAQNHFESWERVIIALEQGQIAGYCTTAKKDCIPNVPYSPYISYVFVGEPFRGKRLSEQMIRFACRYLAGLGFDAAYIVSGERGLYEKYGFLKIDEKKSIYDHVEQIFYKKL